MGGWGGSIVQVVGVVGWGGGCVVGVAGVFGGRGGGSTQHILGGEVLKTVVLRDPAGCHEVNTVFPVEI